MRYWSYVSVCCLVACTLGAGTALAQENDETGFSTGIEPEAGYVVGDVTGQPADPEYWWSWYSNDPNNLPIWNPHVTTDQAHNGSQSMEFPLGFTDVQHFGIPVGDPNAAPPVAWEEKFSIYVSSDRELWGTEALRGEPWSYTHGYLYSYQFMVWQNNGNGYASGFEPYELGPLDGQQGWYSWYGDVKAEVSTAEVHAGAQAIAFPETHTDIQRPVINGNPVLGAIAWEEKFSIYVPGTLSPGDEAFRSEPWNNWNAGWSYQLFLRQGNDAWYPTIGWGDTENNLLDEMGFDPDPNAMPPNNGFANDQWWNVTVVADGAVGRVTSVTVGDDQGNTWEATGLSEPFSTWGNDLTDDDPPGETSAERPERVFYQSDGAGVYLDDVRMIEYGAPISSGWVPKIGTEETEIDLRDEFGLGDDYFFEANKWWNVEIQADGDAGLVTSVKISDDFGTQYSTVMSEPFSTWGDILPPGDYAPIPEYISYLSEGGGVYMDDVSVYILGPCSGDLDGDGDTDLADLAQLLGAYGSVTGDPEYDPAADLDNDGDVDLADLAGLLGDYGCAP